MLKRSMSIVEWLVLFGFFSLAIVTTNLLHLEQRWSDAVVYTVVVFTIVIQLLHPGWGRPSFWKGFLLILILHIIAISVLVESMPREWRGIPGLFQVLFGMTEGMAVLAVLWKKAKWPTM